MTTHIPPIPALTVGARRAENSVNTLLQARAVHTRVMFQVMVINTAHSVRVTEKDRFMVKGWE